MTNYIKFPNQYLRQNIKTAYGLSNWFYVTYVTICLNRTLYNGNISTISIAEILQKCGKKCCDRNPDATEKIKLALRFMINKKWITLKYYADLDKVKPSSHLVLKLNEQNFFPKYNYSKVYYTQLHKVFSCTSVKTETLLTVFLYINSYCFSNQKRSKFTGCVSAIPERLNLSKTTVTRCMSALSGQLNLFVKTDTGYSVNDGEIRKLPNIYEVQKLEDF